MASDVPVTIQLAFDGYWRQKNVGSIPTHAGVYCVYTCTYNKDAKPKPTVSVDKLVYIGEAGRPLAVDATEGVSNSARRGPSTCARSTSILSLFATSHCRAHSVSGQMPWTVSQNFLE